MEVGFKVVHSASTVHDPTICFSEWRCNCERGKEQKGNTHVCVKEQCHYYQYFKAQFWIIMLEAKLLLKVLINKWFRLSEVSSSNKMDCILRFTLII